MHLKHKNYLLPTYVLFYCTWLAGKVVGGERSICSGQSAGPKDLADSEEIIHTKT